MAEIAKTGRPSMSSVLPGQDKTISGLRAGEAISDGDACYIKSDGLIWRADGSAVAAAARVRGFAFQSAPAGEAVTLVWDVNFRYGAALSPGGDVYLSGTVLGGLADAASTGGLASLGFIVDATRIHLDRNH